MRKSSSNAPSALKEGKPPVRQSVVVATTKAQEMRMKEIQSKQAKLNEASNNEKKAWAQSFKSTGSFDTKRLTSLAEPKKTTALQEETKGKEENPIKKIPLAKLKINNMANTLPRPSSSQAVRLRGITFRASSGQRINATCTRKSLVQTSLSRDRPDSGLIKKSPQSNRRTSFHSTRSIDSERLNRLAQPKVINTKFKGTGTFKPAAKASGSASKAKTRLVKKRSKPADEDPLEDLDANFQHLELRDQEFENQSIGDGEQEDHDSYQNELNNFLDNELDQESVQDGEPQVQLTGSELEEANSPDNYNLGTSVLDEEANSSINQEEAEVMVIEDDELPEIKAFEEPENQSPQRLDREEMQMQQEDSSIQNDEVIANTSKDDQADESKEICQDKNKQNQAEAEKAQSEKDQKLSATSQGSLPDSSIHDVSNQPHQDPRRLTLDAALASKTDSLLQPTPGSSAEKEARNTCHQPLLRPSFTNSFRSSFAKDLAGSQSSKQYFQQLAKQRTVKATNNDKTKKDALACPPEKVLPLDEKLAFESKQQKESQQEEALGKQMILEEAGSEGSKSSNEEAAQKSDDQVAKPEEARASTVSDELGLEDEMDTQAKQDETQTLEDLQKKLFDQLGLRDVPDDISKDLAAAEQRDSEGCSQLLSDLSQLLNRQSLASNALSLQKRISFEKVQDWERAEFGSYRGGPEAENEIAEIAETNESQGSQPKNVLEYDELEQQIASRIVTLSHYKLKEQDFKHNRQKEDLQDDPDSEVVVPRLSELEDGAPCIQEYDDSASPGKAKISNQISSSDEEPLRRQAFQLKNDQCLDDIGLQESVMDSNFQAPMHYNSVQGRQKPDVKEFTIESESASASELKDGHCFSFLNNHQSLKQEQQQLIIEAQNFYQRKSNARAELETVIEEPTTIFDATYLSLAMARDKHDHSELRQSKDLECTRFEREILSEQKMKQLGFKRTTTGSVIENDELFLFLQDQYSNSKTQTGSKQETTVQISETGTSPRQTVKLDADATPQKQAQLTLEEKIMLRKEQLNFERKKTKEDYEKQDSLEQSSHSNGSPCFKKQVALEPQEQKKKLGVADFKMDLSISLMSMEQPELGTDDNSHQDNSLSEAEQSRTAGRLPEMPLDVVDPYPLAAYTETLEMQPGKKQHRKAASNFIEPIENHRLSLFHRKGKDNDDAKSNYSGISRVSVLTSNMLNKNEQGKVEDQWYQFIYNNEDDQTDHTRFTISNLARPSYFRPLVGLKNSTQSTQLDLNPALRLNELLEQLDIFRFMRLNWLLSPIVCTTAIRERIFNFNNQQVQEVINSSVKDPAKKAKCLYLQGELQACMRFCEQCRWSYLKQRQVLNLKQNQFTALAMVEIYVIELACIIDLIKTPHCSDFQRQQIRHRGHQLLDEIPILVKNKQQHQFTIIELLLQYKESRAYQKLKDLDFISFKLFRLERAIHQESKGEADNSMYLRKDDDEAQDPVQYAQKIQRQFSKVADHSKKIEFYIFGALSAYRNHHFIEAINFLSQAPFICNFGEQEMSFDALALQQMLKMAENKLLTKVGQPERAIIQLTSQFFEQTMIGNEQYAQHFHSSVTSLAPSLQQKTMYLSSLWCLYKAVKYQLKLTQFNLDHCLFSGETNPSAEASASVPKAVCDLVNQLLQLKSIVDSSSFLPVGQSTKDFDSFTWLLHKELLSLRTNESVSAALAANDIFALILQDFDLEAGVMSLLERPSLMPVLLKPDNKKLIETALALKTPRSKKTRPKTDGELQALIQQSSGHFYSLFAVFKRLVQDKFYKLSSRKSPARTSLAEVFSSTASCTSFLKDIRQMYPVGQKARLAEVVGTLQVALNLFLSSVHMVCFTELTTVKEIASFKLRKESAKQATSRHTSLKFKALTTNKLRTLYINHETVKFELQKVKNYQGDYKTDIDDVSAFDLTSVFEPVAANYDMVSTFQALDDIRQLESENAALPGGSLHPGERPSFGPGLEEAKTVSGQHKPVCGSAGLSDQYSAYSSSQFEGGDADESPRSFEDQSRGKSTKLNLYRVAKISYFNESPSPMRLNPQRPSSKAPFQKNFQAQAADQTGQDLGQANLPLDDLVNLEHSPFLGESSDDGSTSHVSVPDLVETQEEQLHFLMHGCNLHSAEDLLTLLLAVVLSDSNHSLGIKVASVLIDLAEERKVLGQGAKLKFKFILQLQLHLQARLQVQTFERGRQEVARLMGKQAFNR